MTTKIRAAMAMLALGLCVSCAGAPIPTARVAQAKESIGAAKASGAEENPRAALHLKMARDSVGRAEHLIDDGRNDAAERAALEADLDARVAQALAREEQARGQADQAVARVHDLGARAE